MFNHCQQYSSNFANNHLAKLFRDSCQLPLNIMLGLISWNKVSPKNSLQYDNFIEKMPNELLVKIFQYCDDNDFGNLRLQCSRFDQLITTCGVLLAKRYRQRLVTCLTITYNASNDTFVLATLKKSQSNKKNTMEISRADVLRGCYHNFRYCFRRFRVLGLQFHNLPLCSRTLRYFCDLLSCCSTLEPKTLRLCDCYVANLQHDALMRLMNLCAKSLIVLSFINLAGVKPSLFHDDLFQMINRKTIYVLMIQSIEFHFSVPLGDQHLRLGDSILLTLPSTMRKIKLEKCQNITADGICNYIERYFRREEKGTTRNYRCTEIAFRQCKRLSTAQFERAAQLRHICIDGGEQPDGEYIMSWVKRRQYHLKHAHHKRLLVIEIDSHYLTTQSGLSSPAAIEEITQNPSHLMPFLGLCPVHHHPVLIERILMPAVNSARMSQKLNQEWQNSVLSRINRRYSKIAQHSPGFLQPVIKTANIIRRINYSNQPSHRLSFPQ